MQCFVGSTVISFFTPFPSTGIQSTIMLPPLAAASCGGRGAFATGSDGPARRPAGGWADTIAPAVMTPSIRAAAAAFSLVSIMVLHVLSHKEIADREIASRLAAPPAERPTAARAVACVKPGRITTAGIAGR